jgi:uncharacterized membrane protein YjjP (DUF1212 family)
LVSRETILRVMTLALRAGQVMLESAVSVTEVEAALRRITTAYGLDDCQISITLNAITLSYVTRDYDVPFTVVRVVEAKDPQLNRLIALEGLSRRIESGECTLEDAARELDEIRELANPYPFWARFLAGMVAAGAWILFVSGNAWSAAAGMAAAALVVPLIHLVAKTRVPEVFGAFAAAIVVVAVPYTAAWADLPIRVAPAVVGGLYPLLPGFALVASVVDGLSGAPISSVAKGLQATVVAAGLALGVLVAIRAADFLEITPKNEEVSWPVWAVALSAALAVGALSFARGTPASAVAPTMALAVLAWGITWAAPRQDIEGDMATFAGAVVVGLGGVLIARLQKSTATVYTSIAVLVLVPGFTIYLAMFSFAQDATESGVDLTITAVRVALAIAAGIALGAAAGRSVPRPRPPVELWRRTRSTARGVSPHPDGREGTPA